MIYYIRQEGISNNGVSFSRYGSKERDINLSRDDRAPGGGPMGSGQIRADGISDS